MKVFTVLLMLFLGVTATAGKSYSREYYTNGAIKAEGWQMGNMKMDFWIFYHPNGKIAAKGHFSNNKKHGYWHFYNTQGKLVKEGHFVQDSTENWWIFYEIGTRNTTKFQFRNNQKNGFCLRYKNRKLIKAEKYQDDKKIGEWTSVSKFRRDNPNVSFR